MKISILNSEMSGNCLGRAYLLAQVLSNRYEVEIVGPTFGDGIWPPCDTGLFDYKTVRGRGYPIFFRSALDLRSFITGDVVYALKPRFASYGVALLKKLSNRLPVVLDIDDWDLGLLLEKGWYNFLKVGLMNLKFPNYPFDILVMEQMVSLADQITIVSDFLRQKFGGIYVPHGRDTDFLNPDLYDPEVIRTELNLDDSHYIVFLGSASPHKGVEEIIQAMQLLNRRDLKLLLVGWLPQFYVKKGVTYQTYLQQLGGDNIEIRGYCPFSDIPRYLSVASLMVLPQRATPGARAQVPAKLFDAMAMAKPIISTAVSDIPKILDGCGIIVDPGNVEALAEKIDFLLSTKSEAEAMGQRARQKCIEHYSWQAMDKTLQLVFEQYR